MKQQESGSNPMVKGSIFDVDNMRYFLLANIEVLRVFINDLRIFTRTLLLSYGYFIVYDTLQWVKTLPDLTTAQAVFSTSVFALAAPLFGFYLNVIKINDSSQTSRQKNQGGGVERSRGGRKGDLTPAEIAKSKTESPSLAGPKKSGLADSI